MVKLELRRIYQRATMLQLPGDGIGPELSAAAVFAEGKSVTADVGGDGSTFVSADAICAALG